MRFVVVEIQDDKLADQFIEAVEGGSVLFPVFPEDEVDYHMVTLEGNVPQVYQVPTKFCECEHFDGKTGKSKKYGWTVHVACAKPRATEFQHPKNLREDYTHYRDRRYYMGFRANRTTAAEQK